jgi:hypothetical protein
MKLLALLAFVLWPALAHAERYAVLVGTNDGHGLDVPLRYAESDAERVMKALTELGGFDPSRVRVLRSPTAAQVESALADVTRAIATSHDAHALVFFYYSGHADGAALHLGESSLELYRVRDLLAQTEASVRVGVLDACGVGSLTTREKGLERGPPFLVTTPPELAQRGQVLITAVTASEAAQESDTLRGSFFTTFFVTGLRGAADRSNSGRVTLDEAYRYAYDQTVHATLMSRAGAQHPTYSVDLSGHGDLVLTEPRKARSRLRFRPSTAGEFVVFAHDSMVADFTLESAQEATLALEPGDYEVQKRSAGGLRFAKVHLVANEERELRESRMQQLEYVALARKGISPRLGVAVGYSGKMTTSPDGLPMARITLDLEVRKLVITPRITFGYNAWDASVAPSAHPSELYLAAGLALTRAWERGRFELRVGGASDVALIRQTAYTSRFYSPAADFAFVLGTAVRIRGGLAITLDAELGALLCDHQPTCLNPYALGFFGVRYDL